MSERARAAAWIGGATALGAGVLWALHGAVLGYPFLADDWFFLWETRGGGVDALLGGLARRANYWRPLGREIYFAAAHGAFGLDPAAFRLFNGGVLVATLGGIGAIAARLGGVRVAVLAVALYALVPSHRVTLAWISCAQDLLATGLATAAAYLYLAGRGGASALAFGLALFCKESVAPLPLALAAWSWWEAPAAGVGAALRRTRPLFAAAAVWAMAVLAARSLVGAWNEWHGGAAVADVRLDPVSLWAGLSGGVGTLLFLEAPWSALAGAGVALPWAALLIAAALALLAATAESGAVTASGHNPVAARARVAGFGAAWLAAGLLPLLLVGHVFSAYYVSFAAVGFALLAAAGLAALPRPVPLMLFPVLALANAAIHGVDLYREKVDRAGVSHFTARRLERAAVYVNALARAVDVHPPARGGRVYLTRVPTNVGFATAEDRALWVWRGDSTLSLTHLGAAGGGDPPPGSRFYRFDADVGRFVILPDSLPLLVRAGERAWSGGDTLTARAAFGRASALASGDSLRFERAALESAIGDLSWALGERRHAEAAWERALAAGTNDRASLVGLARARGLRGDRAGSEAAWTLLVRAHPTFAESLSRTP